MAKQKTYEIFTHYKIKYTTTEPVPISDIVESLKAYERLLRRTPAFLEKAYPGIDIIDVEVYLTELESGSLIQDFLIKYVIKGQDNYDDAKKVIDNIMSEEGVVKTIVTLGVGAAMASAVILMLPENAPTSHIEAYNNTIINIGGRTHLSSDDFQAVLEAMPDKKGLAKETIHALAPTRQDADATIEVKGFEKLTIDKEFLAEAPEEYIAPQPSEKTATYQNADLVIFASDKNHMASGWAGIAPGIVDQRVNFSLDEGLDPDQLHKGRRNIKADITVTLRFNKTKKTYVPKLVTIHRAN